MTHQFKKLNELKAKRYKKTKLRNFTVRLLKTKNKEKNLESIQSKKTLHVNNKFTVDFSIQTMEADRKWKVVREKCQIINE